MKTTNFRFFTHLFFALVLCTSSYAQSTANNAEWQLIHEESGVNFFGKEVYCSNPAEAQPSYFAFLKIENTTNESVVLNYSLGLEFVEGCSGCDDNSEFTVRIEVPAQTTVEADCSFSKPALSRIIRNLNLPGGWEYQSMKIANLIID